MSRGVYDRVTGLFNDEIFEFRGILNWHRGPKAQKPLWAKMTFQDFWNILPNFLLREPFGYSAENPSSDTDLQNLSQKMFEILFIFPLMIYRYLQKLLSHLTSWNFSARRGPICIILETIYPEDYPLSSRFIAYICKVRDSKFAFRSSWQHEIMVLSISMTLIFKPNSYYIENPSELKIMSHIIFCPAFD